LTTAVKIRLLLALVCACLFITSVVVQKTFTPVNNLRQTAKNLERNLNKKEHYVNEVLNNKSSFNQLKSLPNNPNAALTLIQRLTTEKNISFITLTDKRLSFWSGVKVIPSYPLSIKDGYSFKRESNGYYEEIKKTQGNFSVVFFIPVKLDYAFQNQYLENTFASDLSTDNNIDIADFTDKSVYPIQTVDNTYLFSVKIRQGGINYNFFYFELTLWILTLISLCLLVHNVCNYIADKGLVFLSFLVLGGFIVLVRFLNLHYNWPDFTYRLEVFSPSIYASSVIYRSLGDLCINILYICWFVIFVYLQRRKLLKIIPDKAGSYLVLIVGTLVLIVVSTAFANLFYGLVINSKINFDVSNVLNLSYLSVLGILMLYVSYLIFYLLIEVFLKITLKLAILQSHKLLIFLCAIVVATAVSSYYNGPTLFYLLWSLLVFIRAYSHRYNSGKITLGSLVLMLLVCAVTSSTKLNYFENVKERETRKAFLQKLQVPDDVTANLIFKKIDNQIINDTSVIKYFKDSVHNSKYLGTRLQKLYFSGYLSRYEFKVYEFDSSDKPLSVNKNYELAIFKDIVLYSSFKVSDYFYRENQSFGFQSYFAVLPVSQNNKSLGTLVIELKSKPLQSLTAFPGLLIDGQENLEAEFKEYSYAFYLDNKLLNQNGDYVYNLKNTDLKAPLKKYTYQSTTDTSDGRFLHFTTYSHLIYKPSARNLIVVSKEKNPLYFSITSLTFFFVTVLIFSALVLLIRWLSFRIRIFKIRNNRIRWAFRVNLDEILYKTRIQFSMIFAVVATLLFVGIITFYSISTHYGVQQDKAIRDKVNQIAIALESGPYTKYVTRHDEESQVDFNEFANTYSTDLVLYNLNGETLLTTQPKIYEFGLQARRMNARAYIYLNRLQKSEYVNDEIIGKLNYKAAYVPLRNSNNETFGYLQLPYFANEADYKARIGSLLNIMFNVYVLVFIAIGLFAIIVARQITAPLNFIQYNLSKTIYGEKNEPIRWDRNDEIGGLVKEYNKMISTLEVSAQRLAQSERENAWREMAKQVAHEIKNPLTPLKLGLQLLDKSWRDKDPRFDSKFERFSKSFVEQIENLSMIASEFSAFAKMPDTRMERLNIFEIINQTSAIFKQMDTVKILYQPPEDPFYVSADRDQLIRCFNNLLKNAVEAASLELNGAIEINYLITNKNILLTLKDNGGGIPEILHERIFEPNFTTKSSGTGLGLAFVKNSIENAGGKVWFDTVMGEGTTFYLSLPAA
jgi:two-component system nitrogen regulation sensor histidine kinase NtrY